MSSMREIAAKMKMAAPQLAVSSNEQRNNALKAVKEALLLNKEAIFEANHKDMEAAKENNIAPAVMKRLKFDEGKLADVCGGIDQLVTLEDPLGKQSLARELDEGLTLYRVSVPIGVIGIIFEARPDALVQISSLCIKSGNCAILKGGKESKHTNQKIMEVINFALDMVPNFPNNVIQQVFSRDDVKEMLECDEYINLIIPRGGNKLVKYIKENTNIPVLGHASGICHVFVDKSADVDMASKIVIDAKTQYPSACNAVETLLIHSSFQRASELLASLQLSEIKLVSDPEAWDIEYGEKTLAYKFVNSIFLSSTSCCVEFNLDKIVSVLFSGGRFAGLLLGTPSAAQRRSDACFSVFLLLGRAGLYAHHAALHSY